MQTNSGSEPAKHLHSPHETDRLQFEQPARDLPAGVSLVASALDAAANAVVITDARGLILWVNAAFTKLTGHLRSDVVGRSTSVLKSPKQDPSTYRDLWQTVLSGRPWHGELINRRKDGSNYTEQMTVTPIRRDGQITHFIAIKDDVTKRRKAEAEQRDVERQLQRAQKLASIGILAGGIAHDFNNLLTAVFGYIDLARSLAEEGEYQRVAPTLSHAMLALQSTQALTQKLLIFSSGGAPKREVAQLLPLIQDACALTDSKCELKLDIPADLRSCSMDTALITQAFQNLVANAEESMPRGGRITIEARNVPHRARLPRTLEPGRYIRISVRDEGTGMGPDSLKHLFEPFFTTKNPGRGLGLCIAYTIVKRHGGTIDVDSELGKGSVFSVYLPAEWKADDAEGGNTSSRAGRRRGDLV